ncbi:disease resistance protein RPV1-like isoform X2 [Lycium barbarum]|uniref:disease resistance protein RPV1-like isoform X2 n=1 Tax=Lycium barbarum TaxID=112863 RepID=UPI00293EA629|nr:disease resistance protein RPV1-like isoform X2 [Lycium barbarum]
MIGIYGVGGIGKTTLAKAIYNRVFRHFDGSCFLSDVRSKVEELGLVKLQEKLLHQILKTKDLKVDIVAEGVNLIKARLESKKVLIILDDVDHRSQLESLARERSWFGSGSLIIITTRDKQLLCGLRENERYKAKLLHPYESLQLFSCHAYKSLSPPQEYDELAQDVIKYSGGLPLALVTLGSHLQGRSIEEWRYEFKKLRAIPHCDIQKILKISFDGLDCDTQDVFLDIACAFHGFPKDEVTKTLNACGFHTESAILTLVQRHLLDRAVVNLTMHDLVRDMGREIVRMESPRDPRKRSRLFNPQEIRDVLQGNKGSEKVEVLMIDSWALKGVNLSTKAFKNMKNLRVLKIDASHISGDFELLSKELRWLSWQKCSLKSIPSNFPAEKLVVLDMQGSNIQEFGLNLQKLKRTPNFNGSRSLKTLRFRDCSNLTEIHQSIGSLSRLIYLDLDGCKKLTDLPSSICKLKSLESLNICWCLSLQTLPVGLRDMGGLNTLNAGYAGITQLPGSVEMPRNLVELEIRGQHLEAKAGFSRRRVYRVRVRVRVRSLPTCVCCKSLKVLDLSNCKRLRKTPNFNGSRSLETLRFHGCSRLMEIHPSIGNLDRLTELYLYGCKKLMNLPSSICQLKSLRLLNIHRG